jgi:CMP-N,N'-diacetyllegionaminic acid synthase
VTTTSARSVSRSRKRVTLALIPARAGSKGLPGKNRKRIGGKSLVEIAITTAKRSGACDVYAVSSDDPLLLRQAQRAGALAIKRPRRLATDRSPTSEAIEHAIGVVEQELDVYCDPIVLLEPTSPFRTPEDIRAAIRLNASPHRPTVFSASMVQDTEWLFRIGRGGTAAWLKKGSRQLRRQDQDRWFVPNGVVFVLTRRGVGRGWLERAVAYPTPAERSLDIDDAHDLRVARAIAAARAGGPRPKR